MLKSSKSLFRHFSRNNKFILSKKDMPKEATFLDSNTVNFDSIFENIADVENAQKIMGKFKLKNEILVYNNSCIKQSAKLAWLLKIYGLENVSVLNSIQNEEITSSKSEPEEMKIELNEEMFISEIPKMYNEAYLLFNM